MARRECRQTHARQGAVSKDPAKYVSVEIPLTQVLNIEIARRFGEERAKLEGYYQSCLKKLHASWEKERLTSLLADRYERQLLELGQEVFVEECKKWLKRKAKE